MAIEDVDEKFATELAVTAEGIDLRLSNAEGDLTTVISTADTLRTRMESAEGSLTELTTTAEELSASVTDLNTGMSHTLRLGSDGMTVYDAEGNSVTISKGSLALTGAITWEDLGSDAQGRVTTVEGILDNWKTVVDGRTCIDGGMVTSAVVAAKSLYGEQINFVSGDSGLISGYLEVQPTTTGTGVGLWSTSGMRVCANGNLFLASYTLNKWSGNPDIYGTTLTLNDDRIQIGLGPLVAGNRETLGTAALPWGTIYSTSSSITVSDRNRKHDIEPLPDKYADMIDILEPVRFKYNDGTSGRYHVGFIAQSVKAAMDALGIDSTEFGGYVADVDEDSNPIYLLRHEEFIGIVWAKAREFDKRLKALEGVR